jgi:ABC-type transport system substrate-binding protein
MKPYFRYLPFIMLGGSILVVAALASLRVNNPDGFVIHQLSDPEGLNPVITNDAAGRAIADRVYEKLLEQDFGSTDLVPALAASRPVISADHLSYTFTLRSNATFSDGHPVTTEDILFSFKVIKNPLITDAAPLRNYYEDVKDVRIIDDRSFEVVMSRPYFLAEYFLGGTYVLPKHVQDPNNLSDRFTLQETNDIDRAEKNAAMKAFADWYSNPDIKRGLQFNIGSGPYVYAEWSTNERIVLVRNDRWWNKGNDRWNPAYSPTIVYKVMSDRSSAVIALKARDLDFMEFVPTAKYIEEVDTIKLPYLRKHAYEIIAYTYIGWNSKRAILADKRVRTAFSHLVDRPALIRQVLRGLARTVNSPIYDSRPEYDSSLPNITYDPAKAKAILAAAGWSDSDGDGILDKVINGQRTPLEFTFLLNAGNEVRQQVALILSEDMRRIGVNAKIKKIEWSVFLQNLRGQDFDAYIGTWVNDPIPSDPYQIWHSSQAKGGGSNYVGFRNARVDEILEANRLEFDEAKRIELMREFQRIVADEQPYTFLWAPLYPSVYNKRLGSIQYSFVRPGYNPTQWQITNL